MSTQTDSPTKPATKADEAKKAKKVPYESNLSKADRLLVESADEETILKEYMVAYKAHGKTDKKWIAARATIYMKIAQRKAEAKAKSN